MKKKILLVCVVLLLLLVSFAIGVLVGHQTAPISAEAVWFYANVLENNGNTLLVEGIPENDSNHRGQFSISSNALKKKAPVLDAQNNPIELSDIPVGSQVRIGYGGTVLEVYPSIIQDIIEIRIVE